MSPMDRSGLGEPWGRSVAESGCLNLAHLGRRVPQSGSASWVLQTYGSSARHSRCRPIAELPLAAKPILVGPAATNRCGITEFCYILNDASRKHMALGQPSSFLTIGRVDESSDEAVSCQRHSVQGNAIRRRSCAGAIVCHDAERAGFPPWTDDKISLVVRHSG
jgi:hypothetical protein